MTKNMKSKIQTLKGFRDFLPEDAKKRQWLLNIMKETSELWGYEPIETPTLEPLELFEGEIGEDEKLFFKFTDYGNRQVALRYDQTVPTCRFIANNLNSLTFPFRRYQYQPVFRAEKPQKGRYREFTQFDTDIFGVASPLADAEVIALNITTYQAIGFKNTTIAIGSRSLMKNIPYQAIVSIDKLKKIGPDGVIEEMVNKGIQQQQAKDYLDQVNNLKPDEALEIIFDYLKNNGFPSEAYRFEPTLARSFSYSDGPIWEIVIPEYESGSVGGGERYDGMMKRITGQDIPATGIAYGFDRTFEAAEQLGLIPSVTSITKVMIAQLDDKPNSYSLQVTSDLRKAGIAAEFYPDPSVKIQKQLKYADTKNISFVIIIGPDEIEKNTITLKDMKSGDQSTITLDQAIEKLTS